MRKEYRVSKGRQGKVGKEQNIPREMKGGKKKSGRGKEKRGQEVERDRG